MAGNVPEYISRGYAVELNGARYIVNDWFFTATDTPHIPNDDYLFLNLQGLGRYMFDGGDINPITEGKRPKFLEKGANVLYDGKPGRVHWLYYRTDKITGTPTQDELVVQVEYANLVGGPTFASLRFDPKRIKKLPKGQEPYVPQKRDNAFRCGAMREAVQIVTARMEPQSQGVTYKGGAYAKRATPKRRSTAKRKPKQ